MLLYSCFKQLGIFFFPALDLIDASTGIFVKRNVVALDKLGIFALYVEHIILGIVLARLGAIISEMLDILKTYFVAVVGIGKTCSYTTLNLGIKVNSVFVLDLKQPCHVVDTCDKLLASL